VKRKRVRKKEGEEREYRGCRGRWKRRWGSVGE